METLAPWTEPVLITAEELLQLPDDDEWRYELVEGRLVRMSPIGGQHGRVVMALLAAVHRFVEEQRLGEVFPAKTGFWISPKTAPDTVLAPDLALISAGREPDPGVEGYPRLAPDLVAEVASPSQGRGKMAANSESHAPIAIAAGRQTLHGRKPAAAASVSERKACSCRGVMRRALRQLGKQ